MAHKTTLDEKFIRRSQNVWKDLLGQPWDGENDIYNTDQIKAYVLGDLNNQVIKRARTSLWTSQQTVASRLNITQKAYAKMEANEQTGTITLNSISKIAEALDCEIVLSIRPKSKKCFSQVIWDRLFKRAWKIYHGRLKNRKPDIVAMGNIAHKLSLKPKYRQEMGWIRNTAPAPKYSGI